MICSNRRALVLSFLILVPGLEKGWAKAGPPLPPPRIPTGIYAVVPVEEASVVLGTTNLTSLYSNDLLTNDAVAGLALQIHWNTLNPSSGTYSWDYLKDAFDSVHDWNAAHPSKQKTIQLLVSPGFFTPGWVMDKLTSCDPLFTGSSTPSIDCGRVTFQGVTECGGSVVCNPSADTVCTGCVVLPLPWNGDYKGYWNIFLKAFAATTYATDPSLVSIAVAGPTAASAEMILPNEHDASIPSAFTLATGPDNVWHQLLNHKYSGTLPADPACSSGNPECVFVVEWKDAIDNYGSFFNGLTLVVTTGDGLPNVPGPAPMAAPGFTGSGYCPTLNQDCAAETQVLAYFGTWTVGGNNGKATQSSGVEASKAGPMNLGIGGVRTLAYTTMTTGMPSTVILGGGQFNTRFSVPDHNDMEREGCTSGPPCTITPEQAAYNALDVFFYDTPAAAATLAGGMGSLGGTPGSNPLNYLQIYYEDIQYANELNTQSILQYDFTSGTWPSPLPTSGPSVSVTAQTLLKTAKQQLFLMAEAEPVCSLGTSCP
jgi:hypothetical protein